MPKNKVNNNIKLKSGGGILNDATDGLSVDTTIYPTTPTMPAYENLVAGDLLKTINDGGTYKLKKITGIGTTSKKSRTMDVADFRFISLAEDKIAYLRYYSNCVYTAVGTISGGTLTFGSEKSFAAFINISSEQYKLIDLKKVATDKYLIVYSSRNGTTNAATYAVIASVSGTTVTLGTVTTVETVSGSVTYTYLNLIELEQDKFVFSWRYGSGIYNQSVVLTVSDTSVVVGEINSNSLSQYYMDGVVVKLSSTSFCWIMPYGQSSNNYIYTYFYTVSGNTIARGSEKTTIISNDVISRAITATPLGLNKIAIFWYKNSSLTTLNFDLLQISGDTINSIFSGTSSLTITHQYAEQIGAVSIENQIYLAIKDLGKIYKYNVTSSNIVMSDKNMAMDRNNYGKYLEVVGDRLWWSSQDSHEFQVAGFLLDHDEFVTSANASYTAGDSVPLTDRFTGFSGLSNGIDYYINSTATGLTVDSTYQKVGKAINDTTILKG